MSVAASFLKQKSIALQKQQSQTVGSLSSSNLSSGVKGQLASHRESGRKEGASNNT